MRMFVLVIVLTLIISLAATAEGRRARIHELCQTGQLAEALQCLKKAIIEHPEPTDIGIFATDHTARDLVLQPEWPVVKEIYFAKLDESLECNPSTGYELRVRAIKDQWIRWSWIAGRESPWDSELDRENTERLKQIVEQEGWPRKSDVGELAAEAAWIILQHSPDEDFQADMLPVLESLLPQKEC
jgi:hypothetical protein